MHHRLVRIVLAFALGVCALQAFAQAAANARIPETGAEAIPFGSVAQALATLAGMDGNGTVVTHANGWVVINEPLASAQWSFTPAAHAAYPAVVRRTVRRSADGAVAVETASLCEAGEAACISLLREFANLNDRITQSVRARGRQGSSQP
jgi:hypothetical protein